MQGQTWFCGDFSSLKPQAPALRSCSLGIRQGHMERGPNLRGGTTSPLTVRTSTSTTKVLILCCVTWSWFYNQGDGLKRKENKSKRIF